MCDVSAAAAGRRLKIIYEKIFCILSRTNVVAEEFATGPAAVKYGNKGKNLLRFLHLLLGD